MYSLDGLKFIFMRACTHINDKVLFDVLIRDWNEEIDQLNHSQKTYNQKEGTLEGDPLECLYQARRCSMCKEYTPVGHYCYICGAKMSEESRN